ncbi:MAG: hypothetical protein Dasosvirus17_2 [Dasosvirus sp.]|uniref:Uncharacterized protein n=1 Tax=Dasosvirus sp. TaxID=2487764 RepID=A0A3G4ZRU9_9VIRU|nr:MAG: hypothetical protein Dasosvirus17_2 [Dasosvirus sp.]
MEKSLQVLKFSDILLIIEEEEERKRIFGSIATKLPEEKQTDNIIPKTDPTELLEKQIDNNIVSPINSVKLLEEEQTEPSESPEEKQTDNNIVSHLDPIKIMLEKKVENGDMDAMIKLSHWYKQKNDYANMTKYYQMATRRKEKQEIEHCKDVCQERADEGCIESMFWLAEYYRTQIPRSIETEMIMLKYYYLAVEHDHVDAMDSLGDYFREQKDYERMKKYYMMAIKKNSSRSMYRLGSFYEDQEDYVNMKKFYLMAIALDNSDAMYDLGNYYEEAKDYTNMIKYYLMAIDKENIEAIVSLANYYEEKNDIENAIRYYLIGVELGDVTCIYNYAMRQELKKDYSEMIKYYKMAIEKNDRDSMVRLAYYYEQKENPEKMKEYHTMILISIEQQYGDTNYEKIEFDEMYDNYYQNLPLYVMAYFNLGRQFEKQKNHKMQVRCCILLIKTLEIIEQYDFDCVDLFMKAIFTQKSRAMLGSRETDSLEKTLYQMIEEIVKGNSNISAFVKDTDIIE